MSGEDLTVDASSSWNAALTALIAAVPPPDVLGGMWDPGEPIRISDDDDPDVVAETISQDAIDALVAALGETGFFERFGDLMRVSIAEGLEFGIAADPVPEDVARLGREADRRLKQSIADAVVGESGFGSSRYTQSFARYALAEAAAFVAKSRGVTPFEYGIFLFQTLVHQGMTHAQSALHVVSAEVDRISANPDLRQSIGKRLLETIQRDAADAERRKASAPTMVPGFSNGAGMVMSDPLFRGAIISMQRVTDSSATETPVGWEPDADGYPYFQHAGRDWSVNYQFTSEQFPVVTSAWDALRQLDDDAGDIAYVAMAQWLANQHRDPQGRAYITVDQILEQLGRTKHVNGGFRPEQRREVSQKFWALSRLTVNGQGFHEYQVDAKGKKRKVRIQPQGAFIVIPVWENQEALDGEGPPLTRGFFFAVGEWARPFVGNSGARQFARMMQGILQYRSVQDRIPKRLGKHLVCEHRIRALQGNWEQPIYVSTLLENAGIEIPTSNHRRFITRVESALDDLKAQGFIGAWQYIEKEPLPERRLMPVWLGRRLVILPSDETVSTYGSIGKRRPRALKASA